MKRIITYFSNVLKTLIEIKLELKYIGKQLEEINRRSDTYFADKSIEYAMSFRRNMNPYKPPEGW